MIYPLERGPIKIVSYCGPCDILSLHTVLMFTNIGNEVSQGSERGRLCSICITIFEGGVARKSFVAFFISGGFALNLVAFTTVLGF